MADDIITRADAKAQGLKNYYHGKPCSRGHVAERAVSNGTCWACMYELKKKLYHAGRLKRGAVNRLKANTRSRVYNTTPQGKAKRAEWYKKNAGDVNRRHKARYREDPAKYIEKTKQWIAANPERSLEHFRIASGRRRARLAKSNGRHTLTDLAEILKAQGHRCAYCSACLKIGRKQVDHIAPISRGGSDHRANIQYLCEPCNQSKNAKDPLEFARERGLLL